MSSDIYAKPDLSKKVRHSRKEQEDGAEWEQREVDIYDSADFDHTGIQSQGGGPKTKSPPSVQKGSFRCVTLGLGVLCLLMLAGIIILSIRSALNKYEYNKLQMKHDELQTKYNKLNHSYSQLQTAVQDTKTNLTQLQSSYDKLSKSHSQQQEQFRNMIQVYTESPMWNSAWGDWRPL